MKYNEINEESIKALMDIFYGKIRIDKNGVGDVFNNKIGTDDEAWKEHKDKIANFWQGMLLKKGNYSGQPLRAHLDLPPFPRELFNIWLALFEESLKEVFEDENNVTFVLQRAQAIAQRFQYMLYESGHNH